MRPDPPRNSSIFGQTFITDEVDDAGVVDVLEDDPDLLSTGLGLASGAAVGGPAFDAHLAQEKARRLAKRKPAPKPPPKRRRPLFARNVKIGKMSVGRMNVRKMR